MGVVQSVQNKLTRIPIGATKSDHPDLYKTLRTDISQYKVNDEQRRELQILFRSGKTTRLHDKYAFLSEKQSEALLSWSTLHPTVQQSLLRKEESDQVIDEQEVLKLSRELEQQETPEQRKVTYRTALQCCAFSEAARQLMCEKEAELSWQSICDKIRAKKKLSEEDWTDLIKPLLRYESMTFGPIASDLVSFLEDPNIEVPASLHRELSDQLSARGYVKSRYGGTELISNHVNAPYTLFDQLFHRMPETEQRCTVMIGICGKGFVVNHASVEGSILPSVLEDEEETQRILDSADFSSKTNTYYGTHLLDIATQASQQIQAIPTGIGPSKSSEAEGVQVLRALKRNIAQGASIIVIGQKLRGSVLVSEVKKLAEAHPDVLFVHPASDGRAYREGVKDASGVNLSNWINSAPATPEGKRQNLNEIGNAAFIAANSEFVAAKWPVSAWDMELGRKTRKATDAYVLHKDAAQAASSIANTAALCKLCCPSLTPAEIKQIFSVTVTKHEAWKGRTQTEGVLNRDLALLLAATIHHAQKQDETEREAFIRTLPATEEQKQQVASMLEKPQIASMLASFI